jgi:hypothetical protein
MSDTKKTKVVRENPFRQSATVIRQDRQKELDRAKTSLIKRQKKALQKCFKHLPEGELKKEVANILGCDIEVRPSMAKFHCRFAGVDYFRPSKVYRARLYDKHKNEVYCKYSKSRLKAALMRDEAVEKYFPKSEWAKHKNFITKEEFDEMILDFTNYKVLYLKKKAREYFSPEEIRYFKGKRLHHYRKAEVIELLEYGIEKEIIKIKNFARNFDSQKKYKEYFSVEDLSESDG